MSDLIDRQVAIETAENVAYAVDDHGSAEGWLAMLVNSLEILPSAQPEIIHCPDCKYGTHSGCGDRYICNVNYELRMEHDSSFYCGYGKRRE